MTVKPPAHRDVPLCRPQIGPNETKAVLQVLEPVFEPTFHHSSHGFRPRRGATTAIAAVNELNKTRNIMERTDEMPRRRTVTRRRRLSRELSAASACTSQLA